MNSPTRFSLRHLLFVVLFAGLGLAALRPGVVVPSIFIFLAMVLVVRLAIVAIIARGSTQSFAIGFLVTAAIYGSSIYLMRNTEFDPFECRLGPSRLLRPVFTAIAGNSEGIPQNPMAGGMGMMGGMSVAGMDAGGMGGYGAMGVGGMGGYGMGMAMMPGGASGGMSAMGGFGGPGGLFFDFYYRSSFMAVGHILLAAIMGWAGGWFANSVQRAHVISN